MNEFVVQDDNTWLESLPPMPTAWYIASATSSNNFLIVTAGMANVGCASNIVEIYKGKQWMTISTMSQRLLLLILPRQECAVQIHPG